MQRDQVLQQQMAAANPPPPPVPETPTTEPTELPPPPEPAEVTVNYFYSSLAPYGTWVDVEGYGRCWRPTLVVYNSGWQPYCDRGHWVYSDCGWYWVSDYSWGVAFHYGRWFRNPRLGWCWWPDTVWAPSWVTWRYSNDYCGWAPLPPFAVYRPGVGFVYQGNGVSIGFDFGLAVNCFTFVPTRYFCDPHPRHYRVAASASETQSYNQTTVINNFNFDSHNRTLVNNGIAVQHITDITRTPIHPVPVRELRVSAGQPWRGGPTGQQNQGPGVTTGNPPHPGSAYDNRNNSTPRGETPIQNRVLTAGEHPKSTAESNWVSRPDKPRSDLRRKIIFRNRHQPDFTNPQPNYNRTRCQHHMDYDNKHTASPRGQQFEDQTPNHFTPPPSSAPVEKPQQHNDSRPNVSAPPSSSTSHSSQSSQSSQSSNGSNTQGQNQNGRGGH